MASQNMGKEASIAWATTETEPVLAESGRWHMENR